MPQSHFLSATINITAPESGSCNMCTQGLPDIHTRMPWGIMCIYQANPSCPCYNLYINFALYIATHAYYHSMGYL